MNASDWNDVRTRAMKTLEVFERDIITRTTAYMEVDSLLVLRSSYLLLIALFSIFSYGYAERKQFLERATAVFVKRQSNPKEGCCGPA